MPSLNLRSSGWIAIAFSISLLTNHLVLLLEYPVLKDCQQADEHSQMPISSAIHQDSARRKKKTTFLWGIMSTSSETDRIRRRTIRNTYLNYYYQNQNQTTENPYRICSLSDLQKGLVPLDRCQIAYTFVIGANPNGYYDLVDHRENSSIPLTISKPISNPSNNANNIHQDIESDVTYLNIRENMNRGKTQTWFLYATTVLEDWPFDYIAKVDSDTLLFPSKWFSFCDDVLNPFPYNKRVYGGVPIYKCGGKTRQHWQCRQYLGETYMSGELFFISSDVARFITSPTLDRSRLQLDHEDVTMANFIHELPGPVNQVTIFRSQQLFQHGKELKDPIQYQEHWNRWLAEHTSR